MGLFDFFKNENTGPSIKDQIWMSHAAKLLGSIKLLEENPNALFIAWFSETEHEYQQFFKEKKGSVPEIKLAKSVSSFMVKDKTVIFLEHYPLRSKEKKLMADWNAKTIFVLSSLDEPLFRNFGGDRVAEMMKTLGMKEDELVEHSMVSKSIVNAQEKLEKKVGAELLANSSVEWFKKNHPFL